jgi:hypothetical protein
VEIVSNASCSSYNSLYSQNFVLPLQCRNDWNKIILEFHGEVQGLQYDRFGALWINNVEVLRTTTPEPTPDGIEWSIEKDITLFGDYILKNQNNLTAYLSIPNVVDSTYTGIIFITAKLLFYNSDTTSPAFNFPSVFSLTNATSDGSNLFSAMQLTYNQSKIYEISLPNDLKSSNLFVDILASGHSCEEFYYTNVPSDSELIEKYGLCGGGIYRELQVFVDDTLIGTSSPFPVIYTGILICTLICS